jgi:hypothetical protein
MRRTILIAISVCYLLIAIGCGGNSNTAANTNTLGEPSCESGGDTPTAAYKRLFEAVKSKQTDNIKAQVTQGTIQLASFVSAQNKTPLDKVFENGFVSSTMAPTLPDIRDERVNCNMGAIEVWNASQQKWEDTAFMIENGTWKLAVGEVMRGTYKSPGKGLAAKEAEAANTARSNSPPLPVNSKSNANRPVNIPMPGTVSGNTNRK